MTLSAARRTACGAAVALTLMFIPVTAHAENYIDAPARVVTPLDTESITDVCGYYPMGMYRHCDAGTGMTVMVDAQDIWGGIHEVCVHPGINNLQPGIRWRVVDAWWNGGIWC
ncbi:DUF6355 family natural product biosynthesis protein [Amycolatopsis sp. NPDC059657]|uniref:DUF6355 family natural product biosynthesis protein n=1 Tax=Amycolatopsis sp. NPDC059657 TaxID=3346899 RepID=UPI00366D49BC